MTKGRVWLKLVAWIAGVLLALILIGILTLKLIFTKERVISMVLPLIESNINRKVEIKDANLSIWKGLGLDVKQVTIYSPPEFSQKELARFETISLKVKLLPLLGKRIELTKGILVKPRIVIEKREITIQRAQGQLYKQNITNWDSLAKAGPAFALPVIFGQMEIIDGSLLYFAPAEKKEISLSGINQKVKFSFDKEGKAKAEGEMSIAGIKLNLPDFQGEFPAVPLSLKHNLRINFNQEKLDIDRFDLAFGDVEFMLKGNAQNVKTIPLLDLKLSSKNIPLERVISCLSSMKGGLFSELQIVGQSNIDLSIKGQMRETPLPQIDGKMGLKKVKITYSKSGFPLDIPYAEILINPKNISFSTNDASLGGMPLSFKGVVDNFMSPNFNFELKSDFDTKILQKFEQSPKDMKIDGKVKLNLRAYGKLENPKGARISASVNLERINLESPNLTAPIKNMNATLAIREFDLDIRQIKCNMGQSDLDFKGKVSDVVPRILFPKEYSGKPRLDFTLNSTLLNLDEIFPTVDTSKSAKQPKTSKKPPLPIMDMDVQGKLSAQKIIFRKVNLTDFAADITLFGRILRVENVYSKVYQGTVNGTAQYDFSNPEGPKFDLTFNAKKIEVNDFAADFLTGPLLSSFGGKIYGKMDMVSHFKGEGNQVAEIEKSLVAEGKANLSDGKIVYGDFLNQLGKSLNFDIPKEDNIRVLTNSFRVVKERIYFDDYQLYGAKADWDITGSIGFDETLDYLIVVSLPMEEAKKYIGSNELLSVLGNAKGKLVLPIKVSGTSKSPKFSLDTSKAQEKLKGDLKEKAKGQGQELLKKLLGK